MRLTDARRLLGPNLYTCAPAVLVELELAPEEDVGQTVAAYHAQWMRMLSAVGLRSPKASELVVRAYEGGVAVACALPIDTLLAATEAAEWAAEAASELGGGKPARALEPKRGELAAMVAAQRNPRLLALEAEARRRALPFLWDDERVTLGAGARCQTWPRAELPAVGDVAWSSLGGVPVALVTGTNGKTTSARLITRMVREGGRIPACTSTDGITVDEVFVERGDCTGPFAARSALTRREVEVAVLETARGGILRRGLAIERCDAALITNVSDDHLGTYGIDDVPAMARVKAVVARAVAPHGRLVLNADDPALVAIAGDHSAQREKCAGTEKLRHQETSRRTSVSSRRQEVHASVLTAPVVYFTLDPRNPVAARHAANGGEVWSNEGGFVVRQRRGEKTALLEIADIPIAFGGAARFNVANALAAAATAAGLGVEDAAIVAALRGFTSSSADNEGRGNVLVVSGVRVLLDFAHNAEAIRAVLELAAALRGDGRLFVVTGHAGDRSDEALRGIARVIHAAGPVHVFIRDLPDYLRGRPPGGVQAVLRAELHALGMTPACVEDVPTEVFALDQALRVARPGDLVLLLVHIERTEVRALLERAGAIPAE